MTRKTRIVYFIDHIDGPGGTERHLSYLVSLLDAQRFATTVVVFDLVPNKLVDDLVAAGHDVRHIPVGRYYNLNAFRKALIIRRLLRDERADIVQTYHYKSDIYATVVARLSGVRRFISSKRDVAAFKRPLHFFMHRLIRPLVDRYISVSDMVTDVIVSKERVPRERIVKIANGVNLGGYAVPTAEQRGAARERLGFRDDDFVIGMVAWMRTEKDHPLLLNAFKRLKAQVPNAKLVFIGDGPHAQEYRDWVAQQGLGNDVVFAGLVNKVTEYTQALDVACLVPKSNEGFSNSVLEKMAVGLPLVVTDMGGNREAVENGTNGFVIRPGDGEALLASLLTLAKDPALARRMGQASRQRVEALFSLETMIARHEELYTSLMAEGRSRA